MVPIVRADVINALLEPTLRVLEESLGVRPKLASLAAVSELPMPPCTVVRIGVRGALTGSVVWAFDQGSTRVLCASFFGELSATMDQSEELDALNEIANIVVGNTTSSLDRAGFKVKLATPHAEVSHSMPRLQLGERMLNARLSLESGWIDLYIGLSVTDPLAAESRSANASERF